MHSLLITLALVVAADKGQPSVSAGEYQYLIGGKRIGEEQFRVFKKDGYRIESTRTLYWPEPSRQEIRYELEPSFEPKKLSMVTTRAGIVTELELARKGENWRAEVKGQGRDKKKQELGRRKDAVVDFERTSLRLSDVEQRYLDALFRRAYRDAGWSLELIGWQIGDDGLRARVPLSALEPLVTFLGPIIRNYLADHASA